MKRKWVGASVIATAFWLLLQAPIAAAVAQGTTAVMSATQAPEFAIDVRSGTLTENVNHESIDVLTAGAPRNASPARDLVKVLRSAKGNFAIASATLLSAENEKLRAFWAAGDGFVDLSWADVAVDAPYAIYEGDELITVSEDPHYRVRADPGDHRYTIKTSVPVPEHQWTADDSLVAAETGEKPRSGLLWSVAASVPRDATRTTAEELAAELSVEMSSIAYTGVRYRAFIADEYVSPLPGTCEYTQPNHQYLGDNRSWSAWNGTHRLMNDTRSYWGSDGGWNGWDHTASVGTTFVYDMGGNYVDSRTESADGIWSQALGVGLSGSPPRPTFGFYAQIEGTDPFCFGGSIEGHFEGAITQDAQFSIIGSHKDMPHHEIYVYTPNVTIPAHLSEASGLHCLVDGACLRVPIG